MCVCVCVCVCERERERLSGVLLFAIPWIVACQSPLFMVFSRQEYCSRLPFPILRNLPDPEIKPMSLASPALAGGLLPLCHLPMCQILC